MKQDQYMILESTIVSTFTLNYELKETETFTMFKLISPSAQ
jgi:hypothetical protein